MSTKFCVICGVEEYKVEERAPLFSEEVKLGKFCGELELSTVGLSLNGDKDFKAFKFLEQLDKCSDRVRVCEDCSGLISETVDKRGELEEVECQVLELQIKLLVKLKELEECSKLYSGEMSKIRERVKGSELNGLDGSIFGEGKGKCDVLGFRERILNVVTSFTMFQDNLDAKLCQGVRQEEYTTEILGNEMESPAPAPSPPEWIPSMDDNSSDFDKLSLSPPPPPPFSPDLDDIDIDMEQTLEQVKKETDNFNPNLKEESTLNQDKAIDKPEKDYPRKTYIANYAKLRKINREKVAQVNWSKMEPLRSQFVKNILTAVRVHSDIEIVNKTKWSYDAPTDQIQFGDFPIKISESDLTMTATCTSCDCGDNDGFKIHFEVPNDLNRDSKRKKINTRVQSLKLKIANHVLSAHLNAFQCLKCPEKKLNITTLKSFREHLKFHAGKAKARRGKSIGGIGSCCEICGKRFRTNLTRHLEWHRIQNAETKEEQDKLKMFQCSTCGKRFHQIGTFKQHEEHHKPTEERPRVTCSFCGKGMLKQAYRNHKRYYCRVQVRNERITCWICGKEYRNERYLGDHLVRTHKLAERPKLKGK